MITDDEKRKSVERGWLEIRAGLGEVVTEDDVFFENLLKEVREKYGRTEDDASEE